MAVGGSSGWEGNPQLGEDVGPGIVAALRLCELASLGAQGFMEPSQCSRTGDEKCRWSWERVQTEPGDCL